jgi:sodium-independent sulfate anion transporter 11
MVNSTAVGHGLAKVLGIKLDESKKNDPVTRGESVFSLSSADTYVEDEPTIWEWFESHKPTPRGAGLYVYNLFPFIHWIGRYNLQWLYGDLVAGTCS